MQMITCVDVPFVATFERITTGSAFTKMGTQIRPIGVSSVWEKEVLMCYVVFAMIRGFSSFVIVVGRRMSGGQIVLN